ncbi:hypothetical protein LOC68_26920 [Blastopirellula sp. JC732]|uniref:Tetratricopeptide repeat protein n=1 Tax=Blastopirellula sediminis TaxID=2894196 RepID=A0A9X1MT71_9BACT|nr:hypothetical protein [Blastopirellula sediminis]MCC9604660.1 hypothetical protein [Blastopirellula sediminis]MCC9632042.1 hypothetical protein [Blastopirellula sediminis]
MNEQPERAPTLLKYYRQYLQRENTAAFIRDVSGQYRLGTLERLAESNSPEVRRAAVLALCFLADFGSNAIVGRGLTDIDRGVRLIAENGIRNLWIRAGSTNQRRQLERVAGHLRSASWHDAVIDATTLIHHAPWYAEAHHFRGEAYFRRQVWELAARDNHQALEINPYHFPAAICLAQCNLHQGEVILALENFRRALRLNPNLDAVRSQVGYLERQLEEN